MIFSLERILDYVNLGCISLNIFFVIYLRFSNYLFFKQYGAQIISKKTIRFLDGVLIIESLFLAALYSWIKNNILFGAEELSLTLYNIAEHGKSLYFLSACFLIWKEARYDKIKILSKINQAKNIINSIRGTINEL